MGKVVLAYSGGLDTSVAIKWLNEKYGLEVIAMVADVGEGRDLDFIRKKALDVGATKCHVVDAREDFVTNYAFKALQANALYEGKYPLSAALSRPLICKLLVEVAHAEGAEAVAHGCTGKGNDQVRFDVSCAALDPNLKVIAPVREWPMSREEEIDYAVKHNIPVPVGKKNPFSIDQNLWGRSVECGVIEDPWQEPPGEAFLWTKDPVCAPDEPEYVEIGFEKGTPVTLNGAAMHPVDLVARLNEIGGRHGVGRLDMVEDRLVGIKSREVYECPAALILITAHKDLESLTLPRETLHFKSIIDQEYSKLTYFGLWYSQLKEALDAFISYTAQCVTGKVRVKLYKGSCQVVGRSSPYSMYDHALATYDKTDAFDHQAAKGFIDLWGLPTRVFAQVHRTRCTAPESPDAKKQDSVEPMSIGDVAAC